MPDEAESKRAYSGRPAPPAAAAARTLVGVAVGLVSAGLLTVAVFAGGARSSSVLASGLLFSLTALVAGAFVGFLFGIPRALSPVDPAARASQRSQGGGYGANTNLEQISDWLTKILVGIGLTQIGALGEGLGRMFSSMEPALGGGPHSLTFAGGIVIYFTVLGFLAGWLLTRVLLGETLSAADRRALDTFLEAAAAESAGAVDEARALRQEAIQAYRKEVAPFAQSYELLRTTPSGEPRIAAMARLLESARQASTTSGMTQDVARQLFKTGGEGERIYVLGLMQGNPDRADVAVAIDAIEQSRSAFEQYQGLELGRRMVDRLDAEELRALSDAVLRQRQPGGHLVPGRDRWHISERLLEAIAKFDGTPPPATPPRTGTPNTTP